MALNVFDSKWRVVKGKPKSFEYNFMVFSGENMVHASIGRGIPKKQEKEVADLVCAAPDMISLLSHIKDKVDRNGKLDLSELELKDLDRVINKAKGFK